MRDSAWPSSSGTLAADYDDETSTCHQAADEAAVSRETHSHTCSISIEMKDCLIEALEDLVILGNPTSRSGKSTSAKNAFTHAVCVSALHHLIYSITQRPRICPFIKEIFASLRGFMLVLWEGSWGGPELQLDWNVGDNLRGLWGVSDTLSAALGVRSDQCVWNLAKQRHNERKWEFNTNFLTKSGTPPPPPMSASLPNALALLTPPPALQ